MTHLNSMKNLKKSLMKIGYRTCDIQYRIFIEADVLYPERLYELHNDLRFLSDRMKIGKNEKSATKLHEREEYVFRIKNLKQALNHGLVLKKLRRVIKFIQKPWLKPYINVILELRKNPKTDFGKKFFKLMTM